MLQDLTPPDHSKAERCPNHLTVKAMHLNPNSPVILQIDGEVPYGQHAMSAKERADTFNLDSGGVGDSLDEVVIRKGGDFLSERPTGRASFATVRKQKKRVNSMRRIQPWHLKLKPICVLLLPLLLLSEWTSAVADEGYRSSYYKDGEIHVNVLGTPEEKPLTSGHWDFKPSWSKTGDMLVFFRRLVNHREVGKWKTAICIINVDGTGFHQLTDGTHTDFNQTWTRDGTNTPIWNRKNPKTGGYQVMASKVGGKPGEEFALTAKTYSTWAYTCLTDGRIFVSAHPPNQPRGYYLMTPNAGRASSPAEAQKAGSRLAPQPRFEAVTCELAKSGTLDRVSISPSETKICFDFTKGFQRKVPGRTLYVADFDAKSRSLSNAKPFANEAGKPVWFDYPRWTKDESAIVYHAGGKLFLYTLADGSTKQVSTDDNADYRYPHAQATPK